MGPIEVVVQGPTAYTVSQGTATVDYAVKPAK